MVLNLMVVNCALTHVYLSSNESRSISNLTVEENLKYVRAAQGEETANVRHSTSSASRALHCIYDARLPNYINCNGRHRSIMIRMKLLGCILCCKVLYIRYIYVCCRVNVE
jgi:hypothetical protein